MNLISISIWASNGLEPPNRPGNNRDFKDTEVGFSNFQYRKVTFCLENLLH